jgi:hypothetical protein
MKTRSKNSSFGKTGVFICGECGKATRETGHGETDSGMCVHCIHVYEWVNSISDGDCEIEDVPEEFRSEVKTYMEM